MSLPRVLIGIAIMAGITYLCRALTLILVRKKISNRFLKSLLTYIPYAVLAAMVFPAVLTSTASVWSAAAGCAVAIVLAFFKRGLLTVALCSTAAVFIVERILTLL